MTLIHHRRQNDEHDEHEHTTTTPEHDEAEKDDDDAKAQPAREAVVLLDSTPLSVWPGAAPLLRPFFVTPGDEEAIQNGDTDGKDSWHRFVARRCVRRLACLLMRRDTWVPGELLSIVQRFLPGAHSPSLFQPIARTDRLLAGQVFREMDTALRDLDMERVVRLNRDIGDAMQRLEVGRLLQRNEPAMRHFAVVAVRTGTATALLPPGQALYLSLHRAPPFGRSFVTVQLSLVGQDGSGDGAIAARAQFTVPHLVVDPGRPALSVSSFLVRAGRRPIVHLAFSTQSAALSSRALSPGASWLVRAELGVGAHAMGTVHNFRLPPPPVSVTGSFSNRLTPDAKVVPLRSSVWRPVFPARHRLRFDPVPLANGCVALHRVAYVPPELDVAQF